MFADIIVDITHEKLDKVFQYSIPSELEGVLQVGLEVVVPFGKGNRETKGYLVGFSETCTYDPAKIKEIRAVSEKGMAIEARLVALAAWMKEHYGGTMIQSLKTVLPIKKREAEKVQRWLRLLISEEEGRAKLEFYLQKNQKARARLLAALLDSPVLEYSLVSGKLNVQMQVVRALEEQGVLQIESKQVYRNPVQDHSVDEKKITYTKEQEDAVSLVWSDYKEGRFGTYLMHGITGSGKTEVYMELIERIVRQKKQAIVLIPEIALTFQTVMRFYRKFGDRVSIMNSRLSQGERYDQMMRARRGEIDVMIGPRSALFTPFPHLGLIVIDEEHETTYKSEQVPRYHARETAIARAKMEGASVILGSATPSVDAMYRARLGEYIYIPLMNRARHQKLPKVYTVDLREELKSGNHSIISRRLREMIEDRLDKKEQTMLFINRRGYAGFVSCRECGYVVKCPHCDVSLSLHRNGKLICHYCGHEEKPVTRCPECGSKHMGEFRAGTQQIEELVQREFPRAKVLRMDMDTTREKEGHAKILSAFANEEADILVGTQMIVKGHDFPNVTLVGALAADMSLYANDYRAGERTFQLLTQAAGRAGRGEKKGEAVIQTYSPQHYSITAAAHQDYGEFYEEEIHYREAMGYPPAEHLLAVLLSCTSEELLETGASYLRKYAEYVNTEDDLGLIGPASPYVGKINDVYRKILYIKHENYDTLIQMKNRLEEYIEVNSGYQKIRVQFDFDPLNL